MMNHMSAFLGALALMTSKMLYMTHIPHKAKKIEGNSCMAFGILVQSRCFGMLQIQLLAGV